MVRRRERQCEVGESKRPQVSGRLGAQVPGCRQRRLRQHRTDTRTPSSVSRLDMAARAADAASRTPQAPQACAKQTSPGLTSWPRHAATRAHACICNRDTPPVADA